MFWHPLFVFATTLLQGALAGLPAWSITLGGGYSGNGVATGTDGGAIHDFLAGCVYFDRFFPISDGLGPVLGIIATVTIGMNIIKVIKWIISLIPTIGGGG